MIAFTRATLSLVSSALLLVAGPAVAQTADEILAKYFEVTGQEKMNKVTSMTMTGKLALGPNEAPVAIYSKRPNKTRWNITIQGRELTPQAYDGKDAWRLMNGYSLEVQDIAGDDLKDLIEEADFDSPLYNYKDKGHAAEYMGEEDVEGTKALKIKLTKKSGNITYYFIDADSYVLLKSVSKSKRNGAEIESEAIFSNYQMFDGMAVPMSVEYRQVGAPAGQKMTFEKADFTTPIDDSVFARPAKSAPAPGK